MKLKSIVLIFVLFSPFIAPSSARAHWYACESKKDFDAYAVTDDYLKFNVTEAEKRPKSFKGRSGGICKRISRKDPVDRIKKSSWHYCIKTPAWSDCLWIQKRYFDLFYKKQGRPHYYRVRGD